MDVHRGVTPAQAGLESLSFDPTHMQSSVGLAVGRSKYECIQFCLQSIDSVRSDNNSDNTDIGSGWDISKTTVVTPASLQLIRTGLLRRLNDHGGWIELLDSVLLFINCMDENGQSKAYLQYGNEFLRGGRYFTWFIGTKRWLTEHGNLPRIIRSSRHASTHSGDSDNNSNHKDSTVYLFARQGSQAYVYCGRCRLVLEDAPSSRRRLFQLTFELLDFEPPPPSPSSSSLGSDVDNDNRLQLRTSEGIADTDSVNQTVEISEINEETSQNDNRRNINAGISADGKKQSERVSVPPDTISKQKRYLVDSSLFMNMVAIHTEKMAMSNSLE